MFSRRTSWLHAENAIAHAIEERRASGKPFIDLTETNPTRINLAFPADTIKEALTRDAALTYSPLPFGLFSAREAVSSYHAGRVPPEHICLTASTSEGYSWLFKLLCDPGDSVLIPSPGYPLFDLLAGMENVQLAPYLTRAWDDWSIDFEQLESQLSGTTRAIVLVSPNNPTGAVLHTGDLLRLVEVCRRHQLALICDEVFAEYALPHPGRIPSLAGFDEVLTFVLSGLSKACLLPQLKAGWIAVSGPEVERSEALARLETIADSFLSVSTPTQLALPMLLSLRGELQRQLNARLRTNRALLASELAGTAGTLLPSDGGWSAVIKVPRSCSEEEWVRRLLDEAGVLVHPGFFFDFESPGWLVLSLILSEERFAEGIGRLVRSLNTSPSLSASE